LYEALEKLVDIERVPTPEAEEEETHVVVASDSGVDLKATNSSCLSTAERSHDTKKKKKSKISNEHCLWNE